MPLIITLAHQKGGVGKSTLSFNLAQTLAELKKTAIVDFDPQGTLSQLSSIAGEFTIYSGLTSKEKILELKEGIIIIDTPPYLTSHLQMLFEISSVILIPTKASVADLMAIRSTIALLEKYKQSHKSMVVLNMVKPNTTLTRTAREELMNFNVNVAGVEISDRVTYTRSLHSNVLDAKATLQIEQLIKEILKLNIKNNEKQQR